MRAVLAACLGAALAGTTLAATPAVAEPSPAPADDPFYAPPSPLPPGEAGDVIRSRESKFVLQPISQYPYAGVKAWQVMYRSENATGDVIPVTGTVLVPTKAWEGPGQRPLVSYAVGTRGIGDQCAPSYTLTKGLDYEGPFIAGALNRGWAVAITDMEGLGIPGKQHTYEVGRSQGRAVLDILRAAQRLPGTGLNASTPVGVWGYSQGGTSAGWAAQLAATYAPELDLKGVAANGVPADLTAVGENLDGGPYVALAFLASVGLDAAYPELDLESYLNDKGRELLARSGDICLLSADGVSTFLGTAFKRITDFAHTNPLESPVWQARLNENKLGGTKPAAPVFQGHGAVDAMIPFAQAEALRKDWCALGGNVTFRSYPLSGHIQGALTSRSDSMNFLSDRFAGKPVTGNC
ncbi:MAG TPA: lipase family protein [Thermomonospora sp.]|nr:lipase family protein [Thermomonospora sp.]